MKCQREGCQRQATHAIKICVPASGWPKDEARALQFILGMKCCRDHAAAFDPADVLLQPTPNDPDATFADVVLPAMARMSGSTIPPDASRAWTVPVRLDSEDFKAFERVQARSREGRA